MIGQPECSWSLYDKWTPLSQIHIIRYFGFMYVRYIYPYFSGLLYWQGGDHRVSPVSVKLPEEYIQAQIKENIKAPRRWPLCGEFTGDFPVHMASDAENVSNWWRHHDLEYAVHDEITTSTCFPRPLCKVSTVQCPAWRTNDIQIWRFFIVHQNKLLNIQSSGLWHKMP